MQQCVESVFRPIRSIFLLCLRTFWYCFREPKSFHQEKVHADSTRLVLRDNSDDINNNTPPKGPLIAFSYGGMLWAYYLGVIACLRDHFDIVGSNPCFSGVSAGTSAVLTMFLELSIEQGFDCGLGWQRLFDNRPLKYWFLSTSQILNMITDKFTSFGMDDKVLAEQYKKFGGSEAIYFGVSALEWDWAHFWTLNTSHVLLDDFKSLKQMFYAGLCSMRSIPFFRSIGCYDGSYVLDGALTSNYSIPSKYQFDGEDKVIRIAVLNHKSIPATIKPTENFEWNEWITSGDLVDNLQRFERGYRDAACIGSLVECVRKGLVWKHGIQWESIRDGKGLGDWEDHLDERVEQWNGRIRKYFET